MGWLANRIFGSLFDWLTGVAPWLWLALCAMVSAYLFFAAPLVFKRAWKALSIAAVAGFVVLWTWQHFAGVADLAKKNTELQRQLEEAEQRAADLDRSIDDYLVAVNDLERSQRQIRAEIGQARQGLDSATIREDVENDPVQAAVDLSDRWNALGRMSDAATSAFGRATPAAARTGPDADAGD